MTIVIQSIAPIAPSLRQPFAARCGKKDKDTGAIIAPCIFPIGGDMNRPTYCERDSATHFQVLRRYCADGFVSEWATYRNAAIDLMSQGLSVRDVAIHLRIGNQAARQLLESPHAP